MSRAIPDLTQGFTGVSLPKIGPRQMGTDADGRTSVVTLLNQVTESIASMHDNQTNTRPDYLPENGMWCFTAPDGTKTVYQYDGKKDVSLWEVDTTGTAYWTSYVEPVFPSPYELCEFYYFRIPSLREGFQPAQGGIIANAATLYPHVWEYLQSIEGALISVSETAWQEMTTASWATLANGEKVGWNGIGGVPFYAPDWNTGALRLPDLRGMYAEAAGFDSLGVGDVHGDAMRDFASSFYPSVGGITEGAFTMTAEGTGSAALGAGGQRQRIRLTPSRVTPVASKVQVRSWGALACVYLGAPR